MICLTSTNITISEPDSDAVERYIYEIASGSQEHFGKLYDLIKDQIYGYILSLMKNTYDAEDILHDCFLTIWNSADTYTGRNKPMAWIFTIARNLCYMRFRKMKDIESLPEENWEEYILDKTEMTMEDRYILSECIAHLEREEQEILLMHALGGLKHREIAGITELPLSTVISKYHRSIKKIRKFLEEGI